MKSLDDFDLTNRFHRYKARKAGFDVPKLAAGAKPVDYDALVDRSGDCWRWMGSKNQWGYGIFQKGGTTVMAHRYIYSKKHGPLPTKSILMHKCDNPGCVNPDHLIVGTHQLNQADKFAKGRQAKGDNVGSAVLTSDQVLEIRGKYRRKVVTYKMLAVEYSVHQDTIQKAVRGINWGHL